MIFKFDSKERSMNKDEEFEFFKRKHENLASGKQNLFLEVEGNKREYPGRYFPLINLKKNPFSLISVKLEANNENIEVYFLHKETNSFFKCGKIKENFKDLIDLLDGKEYSADIVGYTTNDYNLNLLLSLRIF